MSITNDYHDLYPTHPGPAELQPLAGNSDNDVSRGNAGVLPADASSQPYVYRETGWEAVSGASDLSDDDLVSVDLGGGLITETTYAQAKATGLLGPDVVSNGYASPQSTEDPYSEPEEASEPSPQEYAGVSPETPDEITNLHLHLKANDIPSYAVMALDGHVDSTGTVSDEAVEVLEGFGFGNQSREVLETAVNASINWARQTIGDAAFEVLQQASVYNQEARQEIAKATTAAIAGKLTAADLRTLVSKYVEGR